jgi:hypothetical protein
MDTGLRRHDGLGGTGMTKLGTGMTGSEAGMTFFILVLFGYFH